MATSAKFTGDPYDAPIWRKLLALRVFLLALVGIFIAAFLINWFDKAKLDLPRWIEWLGAMALIMPFLLALQVFASGIADMAVHFMPEGKLRRALLFGENKDARKMADDFESISYAMVLLPFIVPAVLLAIAAFLLLIVGGFALAGAMFSAMFGGWPAWAVVITILLVMILLKK